jgi:hypothetical protein
MSTPRDQDAFVVSAGPLRAALLSVLLVLCATMFLFMAGFAFVIPVDSMAVRSALALGGLILVALACYFLLLLRTLANRIEVGPDRLKLRMVPMRGPLPLFGTVRADLAYKDIASVETREENYLTFGLVAVQHAFSIVTRDGTRLPLGVMAESLGAQMPFDQAAKRIAARAHLSVIDRGPVWIDGVLRAMIHDLPLWTPRG